MDPHHQREYNSNNTWGEVDPYDQSPLPDSTISTQSYHIFPYVPASPNLPETSFIDIPQQLHADPLSQQGPHMMVYPIMTRPQQLPWSSMFDYSTVYEPTALSSADMSYAPLSRTSPVHNVTPRKTLTDDDRRSMCQYHDQYPNTKQVEIGALFGVERSTVSKVLRQKDKYLCKQDREIPRSKRHIKRQDVDRALSTWLRKLQEQGEIPSDDDIKDKALLFARSVGNQESRQKAHSTTWLKKFKQKHGIDKATLSSKPSSANLHVVDDTIVTLRSASFSPSKNPCMHSPESDSGTVSRLSTSMSRGFEKDTSIEGYQQHDLGDIYAGQHSTTYSASSTPSTYVGIPDLTNSDGGGIPGQFFNFSPPPECSVPDFMLDTSTASARCISPKTPTETHHAVLKQRDIHMRIRTPQRTTTIVSPHSPISGMISPTSPKSDEARGALRTLLGYFASPESVDQDAYTTVLSLTQKLDLREIDMGNTTPMSMRHAQNSSSTAEMACLP